MLRLRHFNIVVAYKAENMRKNQLCLANIAAVIGKCVCQYSGLLPKYSFVPKYKNPKYKFPFARILQSTKPPVPGICTRTKTVHKSKFQQRTGLQEEAGEQGHVPLILILLVSGLRRAVHHFCNCCVTGSSCFSTECRSAWSMAYLRLRRLRGFTVESRPLYLCRLSFPPCHASTSPSPITRLRT